MLGNRRIDLCGHFVYHHEGFGDRGIEGVRDSGIVGYDFFGRQESYDSSIPEFLHH
jgi:hypothetical protein